MSQLPAALSSPILAEAKAARTKQRTFTCSVLAAYTTGDFFKLSRKKRLVVDSFDLGPLIDSIEKLGWSLLSIDHVAVQATSGEAGAWGLSSTNYYSDIRAQLVFRAK